MKKILYLCLTISLIFAGCKKEEDDPHTAAYVKIYGCTEPYALNFNSSANVNDGTCCYPGDDCPTWDCYQGSCYDPGDGSGTYSTLSSCNANCSVTASWNCDEGVCYDAGDGSGQYISLSSCNANCSSSSPFAGEWAGTFWGDDEGSWQITVDSNGEIYGQSSSQLTGDSDNLVGAVDNAGSLNAYGSSGSGFTGTFSGNSGSGIWVDDNYSGQWSGTKQ